MLKGRDGDGEAIVIRGGSSPCWGFSGRGWSIFGVKIRAAKRKTTGREIYEEKELFNVFLDTLYP